MKIAQMCRLIRAFVIPYKYIKKGFSNKIGIYLKDISLGSPIWVEYNFLKLANLESLLKRMHQLYNGL